MAFFSANIYRLSLGKLLLSRPNPKPIQPGDCHPISPETPAPHYQSIEEKQRKARQQIVEDKKGGQQKGIGPALKICQSHTIEYKVNQIVPERH